MGILPDIDGKKMRLSPSLRRGSSEASSRLITVTSPYCSVVASPSPATDVPNSRRLRKVAPRRAAAPRVSLVITLGFSVVASIGHNSVEANRLWAPSALGDAGSGIMRRRIPLMGPDMPSHGSVVAASPLANSRHVSFDPRGEVSRTVQQNGSSFNSYPIGSVPNAVTDGLVEVEIVDLMDGNRMRGTAEGVRSFDTSSGAAYNSDVVYPHQRLQQYEQQQQLQRELQHRVLLISPGDGYADDRIGLEDEGYGEEVEAIYDDSSDAPEDDRQALLAEWLPSRVMERVSVSFVKQASYGQQPRHGRKAASQHPKRQNRSMTRKFNGNNKRSMRTTSGIPSATASSGKMMGAQSAFVNPTAASSMRRGDLDGTSQDMMNQHRWTCPSASTLTNRLNTWKASGYQANQLSSLQARKTKQIILSDPCRSHLLSGIEQVANAVRVTLGPRGRNVLLEKDYGPPVIVNDGVTIARNIELKDRRENAGAKLVQEVATTSDDRAGDGTTSTTILTAEIAREGIRHVNEGHNPIPLQKGISKASKLLMAEVRRLAKPVSGKQDLMNIATVATSGNAVMGNVIAEAFSKLGANAATILEDNPALEDTLRFTEGYTFERGFSSPYFLVGEEREMIEWSAPAVLVCDHKIDSPTQILTLLEFFVKSKEPLVIIADDFGPEAMQTLIINKMRGLLKVAAVKAPSFGERRKEYLKDICLACNGTLITKDVGLSLEETTPQMLGSAHSITIRKERTSIVTHADAKPSIDERIDALKQERDLATSKYEREKFDERIAALSGGIARIMIGAATETEQKEKRLRYEDAISAVRAGMESGYVPGGGVTYLAVARPDFREQVMKEIEVETQNELIGDADNDSAGATAGDSFEVESELSLRKQGAQIVFNAMDAITKQIGDNAGVNGAKIVTRIREASKPFGYGWNAKTSQFGDMIKMGVIDPAKVIISAIENSASVAGLVLTTEGMMVENDEKVKETSGRGGGDMEDEEL